MNRLSKRKHRTVLVTAGVLAMAFTGAACQKTAGDRPSEATTAQRTPADKRASGSATTAGPRPAARSTEIGTKPLWSAPGGRHRFLDDQSFELVGETLVYVGITKEHTQNIVIADAATGQVRRILRESGDLGHGMRAAWFTNAGYEAPVASVGGEALVLVPYVRDRPVVENGVAALSGKDGKVRWHVPVLDAAGMNGPGTSTRVEGVVADSRTLLATASTREDRDSRLPSGGSTFAYDLKTRRLLWKRSGYAFAAAGDTIVLLGGKAYDRATGRLLWDLSKRYKNLWIEAATDDLVAVAFDDGLAVVDPRSGREVARANGRPDGCVKNPERRKAFLVCGERRSDRLLFVERTADGARIRTVEGKARLGLGAFIWKGRYVEPSESLVLSSSGAEIPVRFPTGWFLAGNEGFGVFEDPGEHSGFTVYPVR